RDRDTARAATDARSPWSPVDDLGAGVPHLHGQARGAGLRVRRRRRRDRQTPTDYLRGRHHSRRESARRRRAGVPRSLRRRGPRAPLSQAICRQDARRSDASLPGCSEHRRRDVVRAGDRAGRPQSHRGAEGDRRPLVTGAHTRTYVRPRMGTLLAATMPAGDPSVDARHVDVIFHVAGVCEAVMSRHRSDAEVSRLNKRAGDPAGVVSVELAEVLGLARTLAAATDGAFDPTVAPVLNVWRRAGDRGRSPGAGRLREALALVGWQQIAVRGSRVALGRPGMAIDLGGFGKGVALDRIAARLRSEGCRSVILNFGESSLVAMGRPPTGRWTVLLRHPTGGFVGEFALGGRACSTSATFGQTIGTGSRAVSHVLDPRTGRPLPVPAQVTVLARSAAVADGRS